MVHVLGQQRFTRPLLFLLIVAGATPNLAEQRPGERTVLHAHNCYPQSGRWNDRLDRALSAGSRPIAIEQDLVWRPDRSGGGQSVVAHEPEAAGQAPALEDHFFSRMAPVFDRALTEGGVDEWPIVVLHLDFKTNEPAHHRAIMALLERHERWLTTAPRVADEAQVMPLAAGPLLVLTENGPGQEDEFHRRVPIGGRLRIFGSVPPLPVSESASREQQLAALAGASVEALIPERATNYRRWTNHSWAVIERGGPPQAGEWTQAERTRLEQVVARAHRLGLWIRLYALNGHAPDQSRGWSSGYNFGSLDAVRVRWRAAIAAGVDFVATDQYEEFAKLQNDP